MFSFSGVDEALWRIEDEGKTIVAVGNGARYARLQPDFAAGVAGLRDSVVVEVEVHPPPPSFNNDDDEGEDKTGICYIAIAPFKGTGTESNEAIFSGGHRGMKFFDDGDIYHAQTVKAQDFSRPRWQPGDTVKLSYNCKNRTVSYWHSGPLKTTFESKMKFQNHKEIADDDRMNIWFYSSSSLAKFKVVVNAEDASELEMNETD